jgi:hypothetical protein
VDITGGNNMKQLLDSVLFNLMIMKIDGKMDTRNEQYYKLHESIMELKEAIEKNETET